MKKLLIFMMILSVLFLSSCGTGKNSKTDTVELRTRCIDGVVYFLFTEYEGYNGYGFMSPKFNRDGTIALCNQ